MFPSLLPFLALKLIAQQGSALEHDSRDNPNHKPPRTYPACVLRNRDCFWFDVDCHTYTEIVQSCYAVVRCVAWYSDFSVDQYVHHFRFLSMCQSSPTADVISDGLLVATPIFLLKGMMISRGQHVLLVSSFALSICITIVSIAHSIFLFLPISSATLLIAHIKVKELNIEVSTSHSAS